MPIAGAENAATRSKAAKGNQQTAQSRKNHRVAADEPRRQTWQTPGEDDQNAAEEAAEQAANPVGPAGGADPSSSSYHESSEVSGMLSVFAIFANA